MMKASATLSKSRSLLIEAYTITRSSCARMVYRQEQNSSLDEGAAALSTWGMQVRVQVECGREEVNDGEKHGERQNEEATRNRRSNAHHG